MNIQSVQPTVTSKLRRVLLKLQEIAALAEAQVASDSRINSSRALIALGLCQQAQQQVSAACQNLGFTIGSLALIPDGGQDEDIQRQLKEARMDVVRVLTSQLPVSREAAFMSLSGFAEECAVLSALMVGRAEQYLNAK